MLVARAYCSPSRFSCLFTSKVKVGYTVIKPMRLLAVHDLVLFLVYHG